MTYLIKSVGKTRRDGMRNYQELRQERVTNIIERKGLSRFGHVIRKTGFLSRYQRL